MQSLLLKYKHVGEFCKMSEYLGEIRCSIIVDSYGEQI